jgi:hypothetical protein
MLAGRVRSSENISGWREHGLLRDLALGEESPEVLAEKYGIPSVQTVYDFRWRNKHRIVAILDDWANERGLATTCWRLMPSSRWPN